ncbi:MAG TPA: helix-turn-helix domain-containing protein [Actinomycetota bacterium]|nr:helix-turn-helix domain-containing protein [Actinomycetota bacterium]
MTPLARPEELARLLAVSKRQVLRLAKDGRLPSVRVGHLVRFDVEEVLRHLRGTGDGEEER